MARRPRFLPLRAFATVSQGLEAAPYGGSRPCGDCCVTRLCLPTISQRAGAVIKTILPFVSSLFSGLTDCWLSRTMSKPPLSLLNGCFLCSPRWRTPTKGQGPTRAPLFIKSSKTGLSRAKICPDGFDLFWSSNFRALFERTTQ